MCQFGKQTSQLVPGKRSMIVQGRSGTLLAEKLQPGQCLFIHHFQRPTKERNFKGQGIRNKQNGAITTNPTKSCEGWLYFCIFVDLTTGFIDIQFQIFFSSRATIEAMEQFKAKVRDNRIIVSECKSYSKGCFSISQDFRKHLGLKDQTYQY